MRLEVDLSDLWAQLAEAVHAIGNVETPQLQGHRSSSNDRV